MRPSPPKEKTAVFTINDKTMNDAFCSSSTFASLFTEEETENYLIKVTPYTPLMASGDDCFAPTEA